MHDEPGPSSRPPNRNRDLEVYLTRVDLGLLFEVQPTDPSAFALTAVVVGLVALAACDVPARRALRVDPVTLLR